MDRLASIIKQHGAEVSKVEEHQLTLQPAENTLESAQHLARAIKNYLKNPGFQKKQPKGHSNSLNFGKMVPNPGYQQFLGVDEKEPEMPEDEWLVFLHSKHKSKHGEDLLAELTGHLAK